MNKIHTGIWLWLWPFLYKITILFFSAGELQHFIRYLEVYTSIISIKNSKKMVMLTGVRDHEMGFAILDEVDL